MDPMRIRLTMVVLVVMALSLLAAPLLAGAFAPHASTSLASIGPNIWGCKGAPTSC